MSQFCFFMMFSLLGLVSVCFASGADDLQLAQKGASSKNPTVLIKTTLGDITIELNADKAPISTKNFLEYVQDHHYDGTIFHRVIPGFMIQGGGFSKEMKQKSTHAAIQNEADNGLLNKRGTVAMARTGEVNSATAQFFINTKDNGFLDFRSKKPSEYGYAVIGKVISGMDVVDKIEKAQTTTKGPFENVPVTTVEIIQAKQI